MCRALGGRPGQRWKPHARADVKEEQLPQRGRLVAESDLSARQAYRYLQQAHRTRKPLALPEPKTVFTVKLPLNVVQRVRQIARGRRQPIDEHAGYPPAIVRLKAEEALKENCRHRQVQYLNNVTGRRVRDPDGPARYRVGYPPPSGSAARAAPLSRRLR